jgi:hypothetical protein
MVPADEQPTLITPVVLGDAPPQPAPTAVAVSASPATSELITCPECGTTATVTLNRREAADFCRNCDYPLFWTPTVVLRSYSGTAEDSLRRLPGTVGRATVASLSCPHCAELNSVSATVCVRCGGLLHPVKEPPPPPEPVYVPPPPPPVYVEPERGIPWWVWLITGLVVAAVITLIVLLATHTIG